MDLKEKGYLQDGYLINWNNGVKVFQRLKRLIVNINIANLSIAPLFDH